MVAFITNTDFVSENPVRQEGISDNNWDQNCRADQGKFKT